MNEEEIKKIVLKTLQEYNKSKAFTDRKTTDTPTDAFSIANKRYVDGLSTFPVYLVANEKIYYTTYFESFDGWQQFGGTRAPGLGGASLQTTATLGTECRINTEVTIGDINWDVNSGFQSLLKSTSTTNQTIYFGLGDLTVGDGTQEGYGFKISNGTLYALSTQSDGATAVETTKDISTGVTLTSVNVYKALKSGNTISYYINGDLKTVITTGLPDGASPVVLLFSVKNSAAENKSLLLGHASVFYEF